MPNHCAEVQTIFSSVNLDFFGVSADYEVAIMLALDFVLIEMDAKDLCSLVTVEKLTLLCVVNAMAILRFDGRALVSRAIFANRRVNVPDGYRAVVTTRYEVLIALFDDTNDATDRVCMLIFWRFQKYATANIKIPKPY